MLALPTGKDETKVEKKETPFETPTKIPLGLVGGKVQLRPGEGRTNRIDGLALYLASGQVHRAWRATQSPLALVCQTKAGLDS